MDYKACQSYKKTDSGNLRQTLGRSIAPGYLTFTANHFNGPVACSSEGFLDCHLDSLNTDFMSFLHRSIVGAANGAEGAESINSFVKGSFLWQSYYCDPSTPQERRHHRFCAAACQTDACPVDAL
jgi:chitin synthase